MKDKYSRKEYFVGPYTALRNSYSSSILSFFLDFLRISSMVDYYHRLGINRFASASEIKRAYRSLAIQYHPDRNRDPGAEALFKEITAAYKILSNPDRRRQYDLQYQYGSIQVVPESTSATAHRDPRYRPRTMARPVVPRFHTERELMQKYFPYVHWFCWIGLTIAIAFAVDYFLPYERVREIVKDVYTVKKQNQLFYVIETHSGKKLEFNGIQNINPKQVLPGRSLTLERTMIYATPIAAVLPGSPARISMTYMYGSLIFMPLVLFVVSGLGILARKTVEYAFNFSIVSGLLAIINLILLI